MWIKSKPYCASRAQASWHLGAARLGLLSLLMTVFGCADAFALEVGPYGRDLDARIERDGSFLVSEQRVHVELLDFANVDDEL